MAVTYASLSGESRIRGEDEVEVQAQEEVTGIGGGGRISNGWEG